MSDTPTTRASLLLRLDNPADHEAWVEFVTLTNRSFTACRGRAACTTRMPGRMRLGKDRAGVSQILVR